MLTEKKRCIRLLALLLCFALLPGCGRQAETPSVPAEQVPVPVATQPRTGLSGPAILASTHVVAHAMGGLDDQDYLNCLEGFQAAYSRGVRAFEADLCLAADGTVVLRHDWKIDLQDGISHSSIPTREEFCSVPILGKYTPLSFRDLLLLMEEYPDICIITDSKYDAPEVALTEFGSMVKDAEELGLTHLFDRIIIQVYNGPMLEALDRIYDFPHYILTLYMAGFDGEIQLLRTFAKYCAEHGVEGITLWAYLWNPVYQIISQQYNIPFYVHTVNEPKKAKACLKQGVSAVYSDILSDQDLVPAAAASADP